MNRLPDPQQPTATPAGQPTIDDQADRLMAAVDKAILEGHPYTGPTSFRDHTPLPAVGLTPPVAQPGRPPMSQKAADISGVMVASSIPTFALGATATGILWASGKADPAVIALICAAPTTFVFALSRLMKHVKQTVEAAPAEHHHHYNAPVHHQTVNTQTRGVWATTRNELPR
ncbi:hypothetical protein ACH4TX_41780 [Streptomyces sp. NPDC021098]|uniref:hypothetical protein n=1 Tax=unclassified Streptomyces TaxID=2593676 RepID=UPI00379F862E